MDVMVPMMVDLLQQTGSGETPNELREIVLDYVGRTTGKETIYQMMELAGHIQRRRRHAGGTDLSTRECTWTGSGTHIENRIKELKSGDALFRKVSGPRIESLARCPERAGIHACTWRAAPITRMSSLRPNCSAFTITSRAYTAHKMI